MIKPRQIVVSESPPDPHSGDVQVKAEVSLSYDILVSGLEIQQSRASVPALAQWDAMRRVWEMVYGDLRDDLSRARLQLLRSLGLDAKGNAILDMALRGIIERLEPPTGRQ